MGYWMSGLTSLGESAKLAGKQGRGRLLGKGTGRGGVFIEFSHNRSGASHNDPFCQWLRALASLISWGVVFLCSQHVCHICRPLFCSMKWAMHII